MKKFLSKIVLHMDHHSLFDERKDPTIGYWDPGVYDDGPLQNGSTHCVIHPKDFGIEMTEPNGRFWIVPWYGVHWYMEEKE